MAVVSFEVFPPRTPEAELRLWQTLERLAPLEPSFVSVTCGAGGSATRRDARRAAGDRRPHRPAGRRPPDLRRTLARGDRRRDHALLGGRRAPHRRAARRRARTPRTRFEPHPDGYASSVELVAAIRRLAPFEVSVAAYPEPHPDSHLAGHTTWPCSRARPTPARPVRSRSSASTPTRSCSSARAHRPARVSRLTVVPGILLATDFAAVARMATRCGASLPRWLGERFAGLDDDPQTRKLVAAIVAAEQVERLRREGFEDFHFYTLNQGDLAPAVCRLLGVPAAREQADAA